MNNVSDCIYQSGSSDYRYKKNGVDYSIGIKNVDLENAEGNPIVASNYFFSSETTFVLFATIVWKDIDYVGDDYDPYHYDPDPLMVVYRDDLPQEEQATYLRIMGELSDTFYTPTTHYKHFDPSLPKVKWSEFAKDKTYMHISDEIRQMIQYFSS